MEADQPRIAFSIEPDHCVLQLAGALSVANADELLQAALELRAYRKDILVDWSGATQTDASIAQLLLCLQTAIQEHGRSLKSVAISPPIQSWLASAGLADALGRGAVPE